MIDPNPWASLPAHWLNVPLPGVRQGPGHHTYESWRLSELPPIPLELDDACDWLAAHGKVHPFGGLDRYESDLAPAFAEELARRAGVPLPPSFRRFMCAPELQARVRSPTDCYLDPGERVVETVGALPGHLIHFLSDSQSCAHWYLHVVPDGRSAVLGSPDLFCLRIENSHWIENPACRRERIDLAGLTFACRAPSFSEFLYRFWIENEIWFVLTDKVNPRPLNELELAYVSHYRPSK